MSSLRVRLLFIVIIAIIPMVVLLCYNDITYRRQATIDYQEQLLRIVRNCESDYRHTIEQTKQLLAALAKIPAVGQHDAAACSEIFVQIIRETPLYLNILALKPNGEIFASGTPLPESGPPLLSDRLYFQRVLQTKEFSMGEMAIGRTTKTLGLPCAYPLLNRDGEIQAVLVAALHIPQLRSIFQLAELPAEASVVIIDRQGRLIFRQLEPEKWIGHDYLHVEIIRTVLTQKQGTATAFGIDGQQKLYAFMPLGGTLQEEFIYAGIPLQTIYANANKIFIRSLGSLAAITLLVLLLAYFSGYLFIMRKMNILTGAAQRLAQGDLTCRTGLPAGKGEIEEVAQAFDNMADSLQQRDVELVRAEKEWELTFDSMPDLIAIIDKEFRILRVNKAMALKLGVKPEQAIGLLCFESIHKMTVPPDYCPYVRVLADGREHFQESHEENLGGDFIQSVSPRFDAQGNICGGVLVARNITELKEAQRDREKLISELQEALAQVKTLKGFIPICANCKKIRDDEGYWQQIEEYIRDHSEAEFSHGICPECIKELYPELSE